MRWVHGDPPALEHPQRRLVVPSICRGGSRSSVLDRDAPRPNYDPPIEANDLPIPPIEPLAEAEFKVDDVVFTTTWNKGSTAKRFHIRKTLALAEALAAFLADHLDANIVELGIAQGGSSALAVLVGRPRRLVSIEFDEEPVAGLTDFIEQRGIGDRVRTHYGVNQADRVRVAEIVDKEFGDEPLDLVIDDASHFLAETTSSFETLFPRLRIGGMYLIEDWAWQQQMADSLYEHRSERSEEHEREFNSYIESAMKDADHPDHDKARQQFALSVDEVLQGPDGPERAAAEAAVSAALDRALSDPNDRLHAEAVRRLSGGAADEPVELASLVGAAAADEPILIRLVFELLLAQIAHPGIISEIIIDRWWVKIRRGPAALDRETFRVESLYRDHLKLLP